jgi:hypothetical protein
MSLLSLVGDALNPVSMISDLTGMGSSSSNPLSQILNIMRTMANGLTGGDSGGGQGGSQGLSLPMGVSMPDGSSLQSNGPLQKFFQEDPSGAQAFMQCFAPGGGGGDAAAKLLTNAVNSGSVDKNTATDVGAMIDPMAKANGFGNVSNEGIANNLAHALGGVNVLPGNLVL